MMSLTQTLYGYLEAWAEGNFTSDFPKDVPDPNTPIENFPVAAQPEILDRAALTFCMGGPFHPGTELTWPMRTLPIYRRQYRIRPRSPEQPEPQFGDTLTPEAALGPGGAIYAQSPGGLTRWLAVPWQTDMASCRSNYPLPDPSDPRSDAYLPTWWPARVPNHVLEESIYRRMLTSQNSSEQLKDFETRSTFMRSLKQPYLELINQMIVDFWKLGIVQKRTDSTNKDLPNPMYVEADSGF
jgi:hypothetical protein